MEAIFRNRDLFIATKHKKEEVIQPVFESALKVNCVVPEKFDSDVLGTFSGEVERKGSPLDTVREKCMLVAKDYGADLIVANEGSFGPHPLFGFVPVDEEILMLLDLKNGLEIRVMERSLKTNFSSTKISNENELLAFVHRVGFPGHGVILKGVNGTERWFKGIVDNTTLLKSFRLLKQNFDCIIVETDMRALYNPTRMAVIKSGAIKLAERILSCCPKCSAPGFGQTRAVPGLICSLCFLPTRTTKAHINSCDKCTYEQELPAGTKKFEDPMYCDFCNP